MAMTNGMLSDTMATVKKGINSVGNSMKREGPIAREIEDQTSKLPSDLFLWFAGGAIVTSLTFKLLGKDGIANFIGEWAPTVLILGLYNKLVKLEGHDHTEPTP